MHDSAFAQQIKKAHADWKAAENYFENVSDPDLIDYAIYDVAAAKRKYMYLLKQAKQQRENVR